MQKSVSEIIDKTEKKEENNMTYEERIKNLERTIQDEKTTGKKSAPEGSMETTWQQWPQKLNSMYDDLHCIWSLMQKLKKANLIPDRFMADLSDMDAEKDDTPLKIPNMSYYKMNRILYNIRYEETVYTLRLRSGKKIGNIVEVYTSSPVTDGPKDGYHVYKRIYGETKQFIHDFYAWFDKRFPPEDNSDETADTYFVNYKVEGRWTADVKADSIEEARKAAEEMFEEADFGELSDIGDCDTEAISIEDENGNFLWEKD